MVDRDLGRSKIIQVTIVIVVTLGMAVSLLVFRPKSAEVMADADNPKMVELGRLVYVAQCASCHGEALEGQANWRQRNADRRLPAPPHDDSGHTWHHPDWVLFDITQKGPAAFIGQDDYESDMPAFGDLLSDGEILSVIAYIKSKWSPTVRARQERIGQRTGSS